MINGVSFLLTSFMVLDEIAVVAEGTEGALVFVIVRSCSGFHMSFIDTA